METQVKEKVNVMETQVKKSVQEYLDKSEKHLFLRKYSNDKEYKDSTYYKIISAEIQGKLHYLRIEIKDGDLKVASINNTSWVTTKNHLGMMKNDVFPQFYKHKAIKSYVGDERKRIKSAFMDIKKFIKENSDMDPKDIKEKINNMEFKIKRNDD